MPNESPFASDHQITIHSEKDALDALVAPRSGPGLIFRLDDLAPDFFDLRNGLAGAVFQKFMNYQQRVAFVIPVDHELGVRVTELAREHAQHNTIRITATDAEAEAWLNKE